MSDHLSTQKETPSSPLSLPPQREDFDPARQKDIEKLNALRQSSFSRKRHIPTKEELTRRTARLKLARWGLPSFAAFLLISITAWPEINHLIHQNNALLREMRRLHFEAGHIEKAIFHNKDINGNPYTLTAEVAHQVTQNRINMTKPEGDIVLNGKTWFHIRADEGTYFQNEKTMFLKGNVVLYRDDGLLINSPTAALDLSQAIITTNDWVHAEGPLGIENAQGMFLDAKRDNLQFLGVGSTDVFNDIAPSSDPTIKSKL